MSWKTCLVAALVCGLFSGQIARAAESDFLSIGAGAFDVINQDREAPAGFMAYRFSPRVLHDYLGPYFHGIGPMIGILANTDGGLYGHGDLLLDIRPTDNLVIWPSAGFGGYHQGDSRDLGGVFEFHLELFMGYRLQEQHMLGISWQHISNAGSHDINPSADSVFLTYTITLPAILQ